MQCFANEFFRNVGAVGVGCIDEVNVQFGEPLQRSQRFGPIARLAPDARARDSHRAKTKAVDLNVAADFEGAGLGRTNARHNRVSFTKACSVLIESEAGSDLLFDAFSSRELVHTSLENALAQHSLHQRPLSKRTSKQNNGARREADVGLRSADASKLNFSIRSSAHDRTWYWQLAVASALLTRRHVAIAIDSPPQNRRRLECDYATWRNRLIGASLRVTALTFLESFCH